MEKYDTEENVFPRFLFTRRKPQNVAGESISLALRKAVIAVEAKNNVSSAVEAKN